MPLALLFWPNVERTGNWLASGNNKTNNLCVCRIISNRFSPKIPKNEIQIMARHAWTKSTVRCTNKASISGFHSIRLVTQQIRIDYLLMKRFGSFVLSWKRLGPIRCETNGKLLRKNPSKWWRERDFEVQRRIIVE